MFNPPRPWYRRSHKRWYVTVDNVQHPLASRAEGADPDLMTDEVVDLMRRLGKALPVGALFPPPDPDAPSVRAGTVAELAAEYDGVLARRLEPETLDIYRRRVRWFVERFGGLTVTQVRAADVERAAADMGWADATARHCLAIAQGFVRWCGRDRFRLRKPPATARGEEMVVTREEYAACLAHAEGDFAPFLRAMWLIGCRPGELRQMTVENVNWAAGSYTPRKHKTSKKGKRRVLLPGPQAMAVLEGQRRKYGTGFLFRNSRGRPFTLELVGRRMRVIRKKMGNRFGLIVYAFRHSFITHMLEAGVSSVDVAALSGHASPTMVEKVYSHVGKNVARLKEVAARRDEAA
jgi:integrase